MRVAMLRRVPPAGWASVSFTLGFTAASALGAPRWVWLVLLAIAVLFAVIAIWHWVSPAERTTHDDALAAPHESQSLVIQRLIRESVELERAIARGEVVYAARDEAEEWEKNVRRELRLFPSGHLERFSKREARDSLPSVRDCLVSQQHIAEYVLRTGRACLEDLQKEIQGGLWTTMERRARERDHLIVYGELLKEIYGRRVTIHDSPSSHSEDTQAAPREQDGMEVWYSRSSEWLGHAVPPDKLPTREDWMPDSDRESQRIISSRLRALHD